MAFGTLTEQLDTMYTATWRIRRKEIVDQVFNATPFYYLMMKNGRKRSESGGRSIEEPLRYGKNETVTSVGRGDTVELEYTDVLRVSNWDWKYVTGHILRYFTDEQKNRGKQAQINMVNSAIDTLRDSLIDDFETKLFADGTGNAGKDINGLGNIVPIDPTAGTVGTIDRATYPWWRSNVRNMIDEEVSVHLLPRMRTMWNDCGQLGMSKSRFPNFIVCDQATYEKYEEECFEIGRIQMPDKGMMDLGFGELAFKGAPITWSPACPANTMFFLNSEFLSFIVDNFAFMKLGEWMPIYNTPGPDKVGHNMSVCNLTASNMAKHGRIYNIDVSS